MGAIGEEEALGRAAASRSGNLGDPGAEAGKAWFLRSNILGTLGLWQPRLQPQRPGETLQPRLQRRL